MRILPGGFHDISEKMTDAAGGLKNRDGLLRYLLQ